MRERYIVVGFGGVLVRIMVGFEGVVRRGRIMRGKIVGFGTIVVGFGGIYVGVGEIVVGFERVAVGFGEIVVGTGGKAVGLSRVTVKFGGTTDGFGGIQSGKISGGKVSLEWEGWRLDLGHGRIVVEFGGRTVEKIRFRRREARSISNLCTSVSRYDCLILVPHIYHIPLSPEMYGPFGYTYEYRKVPHFFRTELKT